jgi:hypothetical protein
MVLPPGKKGETQVMTLKQVFCSEFNQMKEIL